MFRKLLIISIVSLSVAATIGCTSHSSDGADASDNPEESLEADSGSADSGDPADLGGDDAVADLGDDSGSSADSLSPDEKLPEDSLGGDDASDQAALDADTPAADAPPADEQAAIPPAEPAPEPVVPPADPSADAPPPTEVAAAPAPEPTPEPSAPAPEAAPAPQQASLKKIPTAAYQQGKTWVNAVYIARQNDDPKAISQKIYGSEDHVKQLCRVNSYNCSRSTKVGDKFYYNSPKRPDDHETLKTFYEDAGVPPETYVAKEGDNIRIVGKELLGHDRSWMELWATNQDIESKGELPTGTQIHYWPNTDAAPTQTIAQEGGQQTDDLGMNDGQAPPPPDQAAAPPPPEPPPEMNQPPPPTAAATTAPPPPEASLPPPPPPPPPPPLENRHQAAPAAETAMDDPNQTMALGVGAILLLAAVFLVISIRKKRRNKIDYNTATQTQIDT